MTTVGYNVVVLADLAQDRGLHATAALAWLVYDYMLSFENEVDLIWSSEDTVPKLLYFVSRYFGLIVQCMACADMPRLYCRNALIWTSISLFTLVFCVEFSLMLRIYALYARSRLILLILSIAFVVETLCVILISSIGYNEFAHAIVPYPSDWPIEGCYYPPTPSWFHGTWLPLASFETLLFVLMAVKVYLYRPLGELPILQRVLRDGTIYYFVILVAFLLCTIGSYTSNTFLGVMITVWISAILSFSGAHLLLSIRTLAAKRQRQEVATPDISADVPVISQGLSRPDTDAQRSPLEFHELVPRSPQRAPSLPRPVIDRQAPDSECLPCGRNPTWLQRWECT
ncbi:uncharacterized protein C8Q71DRAFT_761942 [Rhodofomes roseus]|uniref:DUF6533 domain-containing protein n=1 Tax=Rhodofomes roseus TaxID=34475 RepID=A0ABQ8KGH5_9APHY|nr:uncharacterized protein C8Q71DRAFT_761942 [Rhodofomes roseus]KAH9836342.1 hypothetical protein C8Q71DRAFT_761942 [Rhodofomes roseus]